MAEVYLAHDEELDRNVALKVLRPQYANNEQFVERFRREARSAAKLSHPNIVAIHDRGRTKDGAYFIVMEHPPGGTLEDRIRNEGPLPPPEAATLTLQAARALQEAHRRGMVHRDIKPQNMLLTESGEVKVADFGIARAASLTTLTLEGSVMGTPHYISPEQAKGQDAQPQSDLYSLGVVLYEMLTGQLPFNASTPVGIMMQHVDETPRPPKEINPAVPDGINAIAVRLLAKDPADRYPDAAALCRDLERVRQLGPDTIVDPPGGGEHTRVRVPNLVGQNAHQASGMLAKAGLKLGTRNDTSSHTAPGGNIAGQNPPAGAEVERGSSVNVTVSTGRRRRMWPWILAAGLATLMFGGLLVSFTRTPIEPGPPPVTALTVTDDSETLRMKVPSEWSQIDGGRWMFHGSDIGPSITATLDSEGLFDSYEEPGVFFGASKELREQYSAERLLDGLSEEPKCERRSRNDYNDGGYIGKLDVYANCAGTDTGVVKLAAVPQDGAHLVLVSMQLVGEPDDKEIRNLILGNFEVVGEVASDGDRGDKPRETPEKEAKPAAGYDLVKDDAGALSAEVPSGWSARITGAASEEGQTSWSAHSGLEIRSSITATTSIDAWSTALGGVPGIYAVASRELAQRYTDDELFDSFAQDLSGACDRGASQDFERFRLLGKDAGVE